MTQIKGKNGIAVTIIADSISKIGKRITTFELEYHRFFHSEFMTHRILSKNAASSRAIPVDRAIQLIQENPAVPVHFGRNNPGMQSNEQLQGLAREAAEATWLAAMNTTLSYMRVLGDKDGINGHKQWVSRIGEPFSMIKVVLTGTEFTNLFNLRAHEDAQPEFQELASAMKTAMDQSNPVQLKQGQWHLPYIDLIDDKYFCNGIEYSLEDAKLISISCCAQVSYRRLDEGIEKAKALVDRLRLDSKSKQSHYSPSEHQAVAIDSDNIPFNPNTWQPGITHVDRMGGLWSGNFKGWIQNRQLIMQQNVVSCLD